MIHPAKLLLILCLVFGFGNSTVADSAESESTGNNAALSRHKAISDHGNNRLQFYQVHSDNPREWADRFSLGLEDFLSKMGPAIEQFLDQVEDWSAYQLPEFLPNGDIIIRRRIPKTPDDADQGFDDPPGAIDL
ncbi:MAG: hypothetical protein OXE94_12925 [Aestuariivita sp.]|nr:hypothetical protein [Aestuariivita sp.]MCY4203233.1 hypothetical protein [Aestuariivita sp.]